MSREIICQDAREWFASPPPPCSIVTSPPLAHEMGWELPAWAEFYSWALGQCFDLALRSKAPAIIYSTDQKHGGRWVSSFWMMVTAAAASGLTPLWHKVVLRREPGRVDIHRPGFSHMVAFGGPECRPGKATADCIRRGASAYPNGMGLIPARVACEFAGSFGLPIADPFCGRGTVPAVAEALGFDAIGVDIDPAQCEAARGLILKAG